MTRTRSSPTTSPPGSPPAARRARRGPAPVARPRAHAFVKNILALYCPPPGPCRGHRVARRWTAFSLPTSRVPSVERGETYSHFIAPGALSRAPRRTTRDGVSLPTSRVHWWIWVGPREAAAPGGGAGVPAGGRRRLRRGTGRGSVIRRSARRRQAEAYVSSARVPWMCGVSAQPSGGNARPPRAVLPSRGAHHACGPLSSCVAAAQSAAAQRSERANASERSPRATTSSFVRRRSSKRARAPCRPGLSERADGASRGAVAAATRIFRGGAFASPSRQRGRLAAPRRRVGRRCKKETPLRRQSGPTCA